MRPLVVARISALALSAWAGPPPAVEDRAERQAGQETGSAGASRTLIGAYRFEVTDLAPKITGSNSPVGTKRLFNADLALIDSAGSPRLYLAEELPQLNTDTWRVFPDGRMETTYRLRSGLTGTMGVRSARRTSSSPGGSTQPRASACFHPHPRIKWSRSWRRMRAPS